MSSGETIRRPDDRSAGSSDADDFSSGREEGRTRTRSTGRWRGVVAFVLLAVALAILAKRPALFLVAAVGVAFSAYPHVMSAPTPDVSITRVIEPESPNDGDAVTVRTTVTNEGSETLFDLRVVDGVPPMLSVRGGSPRCSTALRPNSTVSFEYELSARPGRHHFGPTTLISRDVSGAIEVETTVLTEDAIECESHILTVPLRAKSRYWSGSLPTGEGASGLEFHSIKEYERGDPTSRIDWRRFARTGELTSMTFRPDRLADVILCVDARSEAYRASDASNPHAVAYAVDAAGRIADSLFGANHRVGLAAFGRGVCFLPPGNSREYIERFHRRLQTDPTLSFAPPREPSPASNGSNAPGADALDRQLSAIRGRLGANVQLFFITPLCDDESLHLTQRFEAAGAAVTVVSPDVTTDRSVGGRLARIERDNRLIALRNAEIPVVDWDPEEPLGTVLSTLERWNR